MLLVHGPDRENRARSLLSTHNPLLAHGHTRGNRAACMLATPHNSIPLTCPLLLPPRSCVLAWFASILAFR